MGDPHAINATRSVPAWLAGTLVEYDKCSFLSDLGLGSFILTTGVFRAKLRSMSTSYPELESKMSFVDPG